MAFILAFNLLLIATIINQVMLYYNRKKGLNSFMEEVDLNETNDRNLVFWINIGRIILIGTALFLICKYGLPYLI